MTQITTATFTLAELAAVAPDLEVTVEGQIRFETQPVLSTHPAAAHDGDPVLEFWDILEREDPSPAQERALEDALMAKLVPAALEDAA